MRPGLHSAGEPPLTQNRPYTFQLASFLLEATQRNEDPASVRETATRNGVDLDQLDRAAQILQRLAADGEDIDEWIRREYILDGWLHGYLELDASPADSTFTTWNLAQFADGYYETT